MQSVYGKLLEIENSSVRACLCTVVRTKGSSPRKAGAKMIVFDDGSVYGSIGGGALENEARHKALEVLQSQISNLYSRNLVSDLAMCCGGTVEVFIEPIMNKKRLYIFGAGHVGNALARFAKELSFNVYLIDDRYEMFEQAPKTDITELREKYTTVIPQLSFDENTMVVVCTHDHTYDKEILALTGKKKCLYLGMIGSQRKVEMAKKALEGHLLSPEELERIRMPIGLPINSNTPEEIAISILAELIQVRNSRF